MEVVTASSPLSSPSFTHGRKDVGITLSHFSIVLLNIPAWCSVTCCKVGCAGKKGPAAWLGEQARQPISLLLEQWVWGLLAAPLWAGQVERFGGHCRRYEKGSILLKAEEGEGNGSLEGSSCLRRYASVCIPSAYQSCKIRQSCKEMCLLSE